MRNRAEAIAAWNTTLDEIAALNRRIDTVNLLIIYHRQHPTLVKLIDEIRRDYQARLTMALQRKARISGEI